MEVKKNTYNVFKYILSYVILLIALLVVCLICKYCFMSQIQVFDNSITNYIYNNLTNPTVTKIMKFITVFGSYWLLVPLSIIFIIFLKNKKYGLLIGTNLLFVFITNRILKHLFCRERPISSFIIEHGYSFPSAHTMCAVTFYGFLTALACYKLENKKLKVLLISIYILLVLLVGFSRIYLQAHYFTDVIFGIIFGLICLAIFVKILEYFKKEN